MAPVIHLAATTTVTVEQVRRVDASLKRSPEYGRATPEHKRSLLIRLRKSLWYLSATMLAAVVVVPIAFFYGLFAVPTWLDGYAPMATYLLVSGGLLYVAYCARVHTKVHGAILFELNAAIREGREPRSVLAGYDAKDRAASAVTVS